MNYRKGSHRLMQTVQWNIYNWGVWRRLWYLIYVFISIIEYGKCKVFTGIFLFANFQANDLTTTSNIHITLGWAVVNLNSNRTCPVCTGLPDNCVYWPNPITLFCTVRRPNIRQGSIFLATMTTPMARSDFLQYPA